MKDTQVLHLTRYMVKGFTPNNGRSRGAQKFPFMGPPLALKNDVQEKKNKPTSSTTCLSEISALLTCLKESEFNEASCLQQLTSLRSCEEKYKETLKEEQKVRKEGVLVPYTSNLNSFQVNKLLKRFPQPK